MFFLSQLECERIILALFGRLGPNLSEKKMWTEASGKMLAPKKKLVSVLYTAVTLALFGLVVFLLLRVRELYHEHLKLQRLQKYAEEVKLHALKMLLKSRYLIFYYHLMWWPCGAQFVPQSL